MIINYSTHAEILKYNVEHSDEGELHDHAASQCHYERFSFFRNCGAASVWKLSKKI